MFRCTQARVKELLHYNPDTGAFTWKVRAAYCVQVGDTAGCVNKNGYVAITLDRRPYQAHRLAWLYVYGQTPKCEITHINHIRDDNRIANLHIVTKQEKSLAVKLGESGFVGIGWNKHHNKWRARIMLNGKDKHLGYFDNKQDAIAARERAKHGVANVSFL